MAILKRKVSSTSAFLPVDMMDLNNPQDVLDYAITLNVKPTPFDLGKVRISRSFLPKLTR